jgi:hypothetical protein
VTEDAVAVLIAQNRPLADGSSHTTFQNFRIRSIDELGRLLGGRGESDRRQTDRRLASRRAYPHAEVASDFFPDSPDSSAERLHLIDRLLPESSPRSILGMLVVLLLGAAALQDWMSPRPKAPIGMLTVAALAFWQLVYRWRTPVADTDAELPMAARLCSLAGGVVLMMMAMTLGHAFDTLLFGGDRDAIKSVFGFMFCFAIFLTIRGAAQKYDNPAMRVEQRIGDFPLRPREAAAAAVGLLWLVVVSLITTTFESSTAIASEHAPTELSANPPPAK